MAVTAIWDVKDNLNRVLDYASNPEKTDAVLDSDYQYNGLNQVISYTTNDLKTEKQLYVTGINCSLSTAKRDMSITKKQYGKIDGILAYHGYQSFAKGEVNAELAHQIGIELAQSLWGERFEVLISTHLDKDHYHNHFVINSISFKDGYRYYDNKISYAKMRRISDELCRKYKLSVIENPQYESEHYAAWQNRSRIRNLIKQDVDYAISSSMTMKQFVSIMQKMGYKFKFNQHWAVLPPNGKKYIRLRSLSEDGYYTQQAIAERILEITSVRYESSRSASKPVAKVFKGNPSAAKKITGFKALYFRYLYAMGILPKNAGNKRRTHILMKEDLRTLDKITKEITLLGKNKINTMEELEHYLLITTSKKDALIKERRCIYNKIRRCKNEEKKRLFQQDIAALSTSIRKLSAEQKHYENIKLRSLEMQEKMGEFNHEKRKERNQNDQSIHDFRKTRQH